MRWLELRAIRNNGGYDFGLEPAARWEKAVNDARQTYGGKISMRAGWSLGINHLDAPELLKNAATLKEIGLMD